MCRRPHCRRRVTAVLDVDASPAYYLSSPLTALTDRDDASFSAQFRVEAVDDRASPLAFLGLMTTTHVGKFGDGLTVNVSAISGTMLRSGAIVISPL